VRSNNAVAAVIPELVVGSADIGFRGFAAAVAIIGLEQLLGVGGRFRLGEHSFSGELRGAFEGR
jgi:hypothetical protein